MKKNNLVCRTVGHKAVCDGYWDWCKWCKNIVTVHSTYNPCGLLIDKTVGDELRAIDTSLKEG